MVRRKNIRLRGKIRFSEYFQNFKKDEAVAVKREISIVANIPSRLQGRTGIISGKRGKSYLVKIKDQNLEKEFIIEPVHLKKINHTLKAE